MRSRDPQRADAERPTAPFDLAILGARIVDGMGARPYAADLYVADGRIARIARDAPRLSASEAIDAQGLTLAPGFIDVHTHDDVALIATPHMPAKVSQGVTTVVTGLCGYSAAPFPPGVEPPEEYGILLRGAEDRFETFRAYLDAVAAARPAVNWLPLVGHSTLRLGTMERLDRPAGAAEIAAMCALLREALRAGAAGLSTGLAYAMAMHAPASELIALSRAMADANGLYVTHLRDEADGLLASVEEALEIGRQAGVGVVFSHHKAIGAANHGCTAASLALIDAARETQEVALDVYPYAFSSTSLTPERAARGGRVVVTRSAARPDLAGQDLDAIAVMLDCTREDAVRALRPAGALFHVMDEDDVRRVLRHDRTMIGSDGLPFDELPHPRLWGTFPRVLGRYVREEGLLTMEEAIHRMTGLPARVFGLADRGRIEVGSVADLVLFDADLVADEASAERPAAPSRGIHDVFVAGRRAGPGTGQRVVSGRAKGNRA